MIKLSTEGKLLRVEYSEMKQFRIVIHLSFLSLVIVSRCMIDELLFYEGATSHGSTT